MFRYCLKAPEGHSSYNGGGGGGGFETGWREAARNIAAGAAGRGSPGGDQGEEEGEEEALIERGCDFTIWHVDGASRDSLCLLQYIIMLFYSFDGGGRKLFRNFFSQGDFKCKKTSSKSTRIKTLSLISPFLMLE